MTTKQFKNFFKRDTFKREFLFLLTFKILLIIALVSWCKTLKKEPVNRYDILFKE
ncbi:MAG: hypothetical protein CNLJKLNK_00641 [Holosporales bacterium]